jgi:choline dehydrogenase-like flavoprotein
MNRCRVTIVTALQQDLCIFVKNRMARRRRRQVMQQQWDATRSPRIGIIGAGPGGLTLARLLAERGITDVTLLERQSRPGGKSLTFFHEGIGHELGTCYTSLGYRRIKHWMAKAGIREHRLRRHMILTQGGELIEFENFVRKPAGVVGTLAQLSRYARAWFAFHNWDLAGGSDDTNGTGGRAMREEVAEPFQAWLDARGLDLIARIALRAMTVLGYGALDQVPALYGLRWITPTLLATGGLNRFMEPVPGWEALWSYLAGTLDVRTSVKVEAVLRRGRGFIVSGGGPNSLSVSSVADLDYVRCADTDLTKDIRRPT